MKERILKINPDLNVKTYEEFFDNSKYDSLILNTYDYIVDAIDSVKSKLDLITDAYNKNIKIISAMGAGNKLDPTKFEVTDINKTSMCPLAKIVRKELRQRNVKKLKVVYSKEEPVSSSTPPGSISFVPSVCGLIIAGEVIKDLTNT